MQILTTVLSIAIQVGLQRLDSFSWYYIYFLTPINLICIGHRLKTAQPTFVTFCEVYFGHFWVWASGLCLCAFFQHHPSYFSLSSILLQILLVMLVQNLYYTLSWGIWKPYKPSGPVDWRTVNVRSILTTNAPRTGLRYGIIGSGSLGTGIVELLLLRGDTQIFTLDLAPLPKRYQGTVVHTQGSIVDENVVTEFCKKVDVVYHTAAMIAFSATKARELPAIHAVNVQGTKNVLKACEMAGIRALVYTSSSHVGMDQSWPIKQWIEITEDTPYAEQPLTHYARTKAEAERAVTAHQGVTKTVSIRVASGLVGLKDVIQLQLDFQNKGTAFHKVISTMDWVYVENVAYSHLLAEAALFRANDPVPSGEAFLISNHEPMSNLELRQRLRYFWPEYWIFAVHPWFVYLLAFLFETASDLGVKMQSPVTRSLNLTALKITKVYVVSKSNKAKRVLGYNPLYTTDQFLQKTVYLYNAALRGVDVECYP